MSSQSLIAGPSKGSSSLVALAGREVQLARREEGAIAAKLEPATWDEAKPVIAHLFVLPMREGQDLKALKGAMELTISGEPLWAIKETVAAFVTGRAGKGFCPNSAEFGQALRERTSSERSKWQQAIRRRREAEELAAEEAIARQPMSDEARRTVNETLARMEAKAAELRKAPVAPPKTDRAAAMARVAAETAARRAAQESQP